MAKESIKNTLLDVQNYLNAQGYETAIQPPTEIAPVEQLLIAFRKDSQGQDIVLRLFWSTEFIDQEEQKEETEDNPRFLQFLMVFPVIAAPESLKDLTTLIFNANSSFDMSNFGLYEAQRLIYYRYTHVCIGQEIEGIALMAILVSIEFLLEMMEPIFTDIALGKKKLSDIQREVQEAMQNQSTDSTVD